MRHWTTLRIGLMAYGTNTVAYAFRRSVTRRLAARYKKNKRPRLSLVTHSLQLVCGYALLSHGEKTALRE